MAIPCEIAGGVNESLSPATISTGTSQVRQEILGTVLARQRQHAQEHREIDVGDMLEVRLQVGGAKRARVDVARSAARSAPPLAPEYATTGRGRACGWRPTKSVSDGSSSASNAVFLNVCVIRP